jgi:hypothetical protein
MGVTLHLGFDDSFPKGTEYCGKSFMDEIISPNYPKYLNLDDFLTLERSYFIRSMTDLMRHMTSIFLLML